MRPRQNGKHFADKIFENIFLRENLDYLMQISMNSVLKGSVDNMSALFQVMAWHLSGAKPLPEPMMT